MEDQKEKDRGIVTTSKAKGDGFEQEVADLFRCMPNAVVSTHVKVAGKDVDIYVILKHALGLETRLVVDAKDYARPIDRDRTAFEYGSYYPLIANKHADQFVLITRNGIVANAKEMFDGRTSLHMTMSDLQNKIVDPSQLVQDMIRVFSDNNLDKYYVKAKSLAVDLVFSQESYERIYNDYVTQCLTNGVQSRDQAQDGWLSRSSNRIRKLAASYDHPELMKILNYRRNTSELADLEEIILQWLNDKSYTVQIALLGTYGTGKSSFSKRIAYIAARKFLDGKSSRIPLLIELRNFGSHQSIEGLITNTLVNRHGYSNGSFSLFQRMNSLGKYFLILDGFDEMKQGLTKDALAYNFGELNKLCTGNSRVMLCGRPTMFESEDEKSALLSGGSAIDVEIPARYVPMEIAPLNREDILTMITNYIDANGSGEDQETTRQKIETIRQEMQDDSELIDLLSRPVHIPMFVTILPDYEGNIASLTRGFLYETFIQKIINREVMRLSPAYQHRYTTEQRFRFVGSLALEMAKRGEARSIRRSEIPEKIIAPFVRTGESIEIASRDLVAACFLEQKAPDILIFGHKSFLEFLTAYHILWSVRKNSGELEDLIYPTREIASFIVDLCDTTDLDRFIELNYELREFIIVTIMYVLGSIYIISGPKTTPLRIGVKLHYRNRRVVEYFCSPLFLTKLLDSDISDESRDRIAVILVLTSRISEKMPRSDEHVVIHQDTDSEDGLVHAPETWKLILESSISDDARKMLLGQIPIADVTLSVEEGKLVAKADRSIKRSRKYKQAVEDSLIFLMNRVHSNQKPLETIRKPSVLSRQSARSNS